MCGWKCKNLIKKIDPYHDNGFDVISGEFDGVMKIIRFIINFSFITVKSQQFINHITIFITTIITHVPLLLHMFIKNLINKTIQRTTSLNKPIIKTLRINPFQTRYKIGNIKSTKQFRKLLKYRNELILSFFRTRPKSRAIDNIFCQIKNQLTNVNRLSQVVVNVGDNNFNFIFNGLPWLSTFAAKEFHDTKFSHLTPKGTVVSERHVSTVISKVTYGYGRWPIWKDAVV